MAAIPYSTARAFIDGKKAHNGNFRSDGQGLYSYALCLAYKDDDGNIHRNKYAWERKFSQATERHKKAFDIELNKWAEEIV